MRELAVSRNQGAEMSIAAFRWRVDGRQRLEVATAIRSSFYFPAAHKR
jgi:hypothetical protein